MYKIGICLTIALTMSACSSSSSDNADGTGIGDGDGDGDDGGGGSTTSVSQFGHIGVANEDPVFMDASFFSIPQSITFPALLSELRTTTDSCDVLDLFNLGDDVGDVDDIGDFGGLPDITSISAGAVLTISSPAGSYAELSKTEQAGYIYYVLDESVMLSPPAPASLSVSFPGDVFPAFTGVALPVAEPLLVSSPGEQELTTASTTFTWAASSDPNSRIELSLSSFSAAGFLLVDCTVVDDGSFTFPAAIQTQMGEITGIIDMSRESTNVLQQGNTVLFTSTTSERED